MIALLIVFQEVRRFLLLVGSKYNLQNIFNLEKLFAKPVIKEDVSDAIVEACVAAPLRKLRRDTSYTIKNPS